MLTPSAVCAYWMRGSIAALSYTIAASLRALYPHATSYTRCLPMPLSCLRPAPRCRHHVETEAYGRAS